MGSTTYQFHSTSEIPDQKFVRVESKFFIPQDEVRALESLLLTYLAPVDGTKESGFTRVESHYFDTPELSFYTDSLKKPENRMKLRVRKYFDGGTVFAGSYIEIKKKDNGISKKKRFRIGPWEESEILKGNLLSITPRLETLNYDLRREKLYARVNRVNSLLENQQPQYAMRVVYDRRAFEGHNLRVTVDQNLKSDLIFSFLPVLRSHSSQILNSSYWSVGQDMRKSFNGNNFAVVEVKHPGSTPNWLNAGFKNIMAGQDIAFSKYVWSVSEALTRIANS